MARYTLGHQPLVVLVEREANGTVTPERLFAVFVGVQYVQPVTSWYGAPFQLASPPERKRYLAEAGLERTPGGEKC